MSVKNAMTADFLRSAYGGESMAHMRYLIWGEQAKKDGFLNIGRLFQAVAYAEWIHAKNHFTVLKSQVGDYTVPAGGVFGLTNIVENLQGAIDGELHEIDQMYPVYLQTAKFQEEKDAERSFHYAVEAEKQHAELFKKAQNLAKDNKDMEDSKFYVCPVCGYTVEINAPEKCPICGVKNEMFKEF
ncbi:rubrerythrin [Clostridium tetanomorphum]|uniref:Rubrerythrin family protein n=1 Tax=Clostridium tetanomorphum TaxID=1553 RepID=A0A923J0A8_CLOTT|nr:rubrerythrin family protein [Clostridium tetanomorphum]KAJ49788.1 rubrerythrin [Clostridium tetanomorphum DSM 665]MBC2398126.1 rubrerythrin family protein [Clostridium tetanomorphum]MBP1864695.1 rubrerythrin [Clostridium tetanomorphum]NRS84165.1 rubrerythrin [Clostridium tetanomorphum]NRZ97378.1 rubrerythrin [Clostridium tetanomorphum]